MLSSFAFHQQLAESEAAALAASARYAAAAAFHASAHSAGKTARDAACNAAAFAVCNASAVVGIYLIYAGAFDPATLAAASAARDAACDDAWAAAILADIERIKHSKRWRTLFSIPRAAMAELLALPLWPEKEPEELCALRAQLETDLRSLGSGFEIWTDWYRGRLEGKPIDWEIERQWALQSPAEINAYLKAQCERSLPKQFKRARKKLTLVSPA